jgi:hypothetical protein
MAANRRLLLGVAIAAAVLAAAVSAFAIIGGETAKRDDWPWIAQVRLDGSFQCGGALVEREWVLTAGHCLADGETGTYSAGRLMAVVGRHARDSEGEVLPIDEVVRHPAWEDESSVHDVALLHLARIARVEAARLADPAVMDRWRPGSLVYLAGWGSTRDVVAFTQAETRRKARANLAGELQSARPKLRDADWCAANADVRFSPATSLCTYGGKGSPCKGDSGGPLFVDGEDVIGVVSGGNPTCRTSAVLGLDPHPALYAMVGAGELRRWLLAQMSAEGGDLLPLRRCPDAQLLPGAPTPETQIVDTRSTIDCAAAIDLAREVLSRDDCVEETADGVNDCLAGAFHCVSRLQPRFGVLFDVVCDVGRDRVAFRQPTRSLRLEGPIDFANLAPVRIGMSRADAEYATGLHLLGTSILGGCGELRPSPGMGDATEADYLPGVSLMIVGPSGESLLTRGRIARVDVFEPGYTTVGGLGVGSSEAEVLEEYGSHVTVSPHEYGEGHYLTVTSPDPTLSAYRIVFETEGGRVTWIRAGRLPEVEYVEHCL